MITREQVEQLGQLIQNVNPDKHYWFFRTMGGQYYDEFVSKGYIAIGYNEIIMKDLTNLPERDDQARMIIKTKFYEYGHKLTDAQTAKAAGQIVKFYRELNVGDVVVAPSLHSKKYAIGIITSEMYEDSGNHHDGECQFVKRRRVRWEKEVWRNELDAKAILAFGNQQTMSSIDDYAEFIERKVNQIYTKGSASYLVLRVNQDKDLSWDDFMFIGELGALLQDFAKETGLDANLKNIKMKINVQSPGDILLMIPGGGIGILIIVLLLLIVIRGGSGHIRIKEGVFDAGVETEGIGDTLNKVLSAITDFLNQKVERSIKIREKLENMQIEQPKDTQDVILLDEPETKSFPPSLPESEDGSERIGLQAPPQE
jgi:hypothetical protein